MPLLSIMMTPNMPHNKATPHVKCSSRCFLVPLSFLSTLYLFALHHAILSQQHYQQQEHVVSTADALSSSSDIDSSSSFFCVPWTTNMDEWLTHAYDWHVADDHEQMNDTHQCFTKDSSTSRKIQFLKQFHDLQWNNNNNATNCHSTNIFRRYMWSSGWGADLTHVTNSIVYAVKRNLKFQLTLPPSSKGWHYSSLKDGSQPVCESRNLDCYFLPLWYNDGAASCNDKTNTTEVDTRRLRTRFEESQERQWIYDYIVERQQQWLRRKLYEYLSDRSITPSLTSPCAVVHVRRSDVVLHPNANWNRRYFAISEYLDKLQKHPKTSHITNLLLLTDDQNAIEEALEFHSQQQYNWMYINRPRFRGTEGGFENQLPSKDPVQDVLAILAAFKLAQQCEVLVHSHSSFASMLYESMRQRNPQTIRLQVDDGRNIHKAEHGNSLYTLQAKLEAQRQAQTKQHERKQE